MRWILHGETQRQSLLDHIRSLDLSKPWDVTVKRWRKPRSLEQNAGYWVGIVHPLAEHCGYTDHEMHEVILARHFGTKELMGGVRIPKERSSDKNTEEFSAIIETGILLGAELGVIVGIDRLERYGQGFPITS